MAGKWGRTTRARRVRGAGRWTAGGGEAAWGWFPGGPPPAEAWTALCLREADLAVAVTMGPCDAAWRERAAALGGCELLVLGQGVADGVVDDLRPREVQVVTEPDRRRAALEATARRLAGRSL